VRILIADDDPTSRLISETALRGLGHECHTVSDGNQAWEAVRSRHPDVIVSDWMMPGLTGLQLCANVRAAHTSDNYTYIVMVTSHGSPNEILEGMRAGVDDYLVKPLTMVQVQSKVFNVLLKRKVI
jgi:DNA-binding response OmpR family regulator